MDEKASQYSERVSMSAAGEAAMLLRLLAEPRPVGDSVKAALRRAARVAGLSMTRAKAIWYREARRIDADEMDAIRAAMQQRQEAIEKLVSIGCAAQGSSLDGELVSSFLNLLRRMGARDRA